MEHSRVGGDVSQAAARVFCCVRSKECFCFVLIGMVLFRFYFDLGHKVGSAPLMGFPYNTKKKLSPKTDTLKYVLFCSCDPQGPLWEVLSCPLPSHPCPLRTPHP